MNQTKNVIVCADDFAVNASVSHGIAELAEAHLISAASVMVLSPRWPQDAALLKPLRGSMDVGLHLDWTSDFALAASHGLSLGVAMCRAMLGGFDVTQARTVIERQLDLFESHWQSVPDHVDGHQHVHQFAGIRSALVEVLERRYGDQPHRPYLRISRPPPGPATLKARIIAYMGACALKKIATNARLTGVTSLLGVYDFKGGPDHFGALMSHWLAQIPAGGIIMCHPAQAAETDDRMGVARWQEFAYLGSSAFETALCRAGVTLGRGQETPAAKIIR